jgi:hypothetical protein
MDRARLLATLLLVGFAALVSFDSPPGGSSMINAENAARVVEEMELATVEALLGPPRNESTGRLTTDNNDVAGEPRVAV